MINTYIFFYKSFHIRHHYTLVLAINTTQIKAEAHSS